MEERDGMVLTFLRNTYIEHPVSVYRDEGFLKAIDLLKSADASLANLEGAIIDGDEWPAFGSGMGWAGTYLGAPPLMVDELKSMGINGLYAANNHIADFGENGILSTIKHLRRGGIPFAGIGASLTEASQPCYISTAHGRVALISAADWGPRQKMDLPGRAMENHPCQRHRRPWEGRPAHAPLWRPSLRAMAGRSVSQPADGGGRGGADL